MRRRGIELGRWHQTWLYVSFTVLFLSGAAWDVAHYFLGGAGTPESFPHPTEPLWLKIHGAAAMATLIVLGSVLTQHVKHAWILKRNRVSGVLFLSLNAILIVTGYGLYYAGGESLRAFLSRSHSILGLTFPVLIALHVWFGRKTRSVSTDR